MLEIPVYLKSKSALLTDRLVAHRALVAKLTVWRALSTSSSIVSFIEKVMESMVAFEALSTFTLLAVLRARGTSTFGVLIESWQAEIASRG